MKQSTMNDQTKSVANSKIMLLDRVCIIMNDVPVKCNFGGFFFVSIE